MAASVKVNGQDVTSPYILQNGDVITATSYMARQSGQRNAYVTVNGNDYQTSSTLSLSNTDITISFPETSYWAQNETTVTINYTQ